ncbi:rna-directed dna polymerase from mobile element jockey-like [Willisornis vidua]|uniref:Rna-directed dna polymerase from mobile element jockey-like n=1 Tax=Willisornis vidua TaxID=1566151 RepID=A0ABQ9CT53_9PASS|nr:rna-directed dna polymerase from mobile element jockey-like [Willisornis vidua]
MEVFTETMSIIYQQSWLTGEVPVDWRIANVMLIYKKVHKEDPGSFSSISLKSVPGKITEQIVLSAIRQHIQHNQGVRPSQHGITKGRSCLTNLITLFYERVTHLVDGGSGDGSAETALFPLKCSQFREARQALFKCTWQHYPKMVLIFGIKS